MRDHKILYRVLYVWCSINLRVCGYSVAFGVIFVCFLTLHFPVKAYVRNNRNLHISIGILRAGVSQYIEYIMGCAIGQSGFPTWSG
jgi:hypothetical protein